MKKTVYDAVKHFGKVWPNRECSYVPEYDLIVYPKPENRYHSDFYATTKDDFNNRELWYIVCTKEEFLQYVDDWNYVETLNKPESSYTITVYNDDGTCESISGTDEAVAKKLLRTYKEFT